MAWTTLVGRLMNWWIELKQNAKKFITSCMEFCFQNALAYWQSLTVKKWASLLMPPNFFQRNMPLLKYHKVQEHYYGLPDLCRRPGPLDHPARGRYWIFISSIWAFFVAFKAFAVEEAFCILFTGQEIMVPLNERKWWKNIFPKFSNRRRRRMEECDEK